MKEKFTKSDGFTRLRQKAPRFIAGMNGEASPPKPWRRRATPMLRRVQPPQGKPRPLGQGGFTIAEGLVAATLISIGLVAVLALISLSLRLPVFARDELVAANLAQEGIEIVRAIRDEEWIRAGGEGRITFPTPRLRDGQWQVHYPETTLFVFGDTPLLFDENSGFFQYSSGQPTPFKRQITIRTLSPNEIRVTSQVSWTTRGIPFSVDVEDHLFNWLPEIRESR